MTTGEIVEGELVNGERRTFELPCAAGDAVAITLIWLDAAGIVELRDPEGGLLPVAPIEFDGTFDFLIEARTTGIHRLELCGVDDGRDRRFAGRLRTGAAARRRLPAGPTPPHPWLIALRDRLRTGDAQALETFWAAVAQRGAPLIDEPSPDGSDRAVTFLWRGAADCTEVRLLAAGPRRMTRLDGTDVWWSTLPICRGSRFLYAFAVGRAGRALSLNELSPDPLNPRRWDDEADARHGLGRSILELPEAVPQPYIVPRPQVPRGSLVRLTFTSARLGNDRDIWVYTPAAIHARHHDPPGTLVLFDGADYLTRVPTPTILDNLMHDGVIRPMVAVLLGEPGKGTRWREYRCIPEIADALHAELMPRIRREFGVADDPAATIVGGFSRGGLAAVWTALCHPETFGNAIGQSGAFWWAPDGETFERERFDPYCEPNWLARYAAHAPRQPVRVRLEAGTYERHGSGEGDILNETRRLRDVLIAKGYDVSFQEFPGCHDFLSWRGTISEALRWLVGLETAHGGAATRAYTTEA